MTSYQKFLIVGRTTREPTANTPEGKTNYADFVVAVDRRGEGADFFPCRAFSTIANTAAKLKKGALVLVEGRLEISRYTPQEGEPAKTSIRMLVDFLSIMSQPAQSG